MRNSHIRRHLVILLPALVLAALTATVQSAALNPADLIFMRQNLSLRLDSLELRKQALKRSAQPLDELDGECQTIRDSLVVLRYALEKAGPVHTPAIAPQTPSLQIGAIAIPAAFIPRNPFDWIIVSVLGIALIAGIILAIGLAATALGRKKHSGRRNTHRNSTGAPELDAMVNDFKRKRFDALPPDPRGADPSDVDELRRRINEQPAGSTNNTSAGPLPVHNNQTKDPDTIRQSVIKAARDGMSTSEICRQFHLSSDHVALLLRVAQKDNPSKA